jgi:predicted nucleic acid-binding protein
MASKVKLEAVQEGPAARLQRAFFDSNILLYAEDSAYPEKQKKAVELVVAHRRQHTGVISIQVLGEFFYSGTRRLKLDPALARTQAEVHSHFDLVEPTLADVFGAMDLHRLYGYSYWDSLVLRCALISGCKVLLSEDMHHGHVIDGLRIVNPFLRSEIQ